MESSVTAFGKSAFDLPAITVSETRRRCRHPETPVLHDPLNEPVLVQSAIIPHIKLQSFPLFRQKTS